MVGEHYFALAKWPDAMTAYRHVPDPTRRPRPRDVQERVVRVEARRHDGGGGRFQARARQAREAREQRATRSASTPRRCATRRSTIWSSCSPRTADRRRKEVFDFLASIGGERYSHDVMIEGRRELRRAGRVRALERGLPVPHQDGPRTRSRPPTTSATSSRTGTPRSTRARAGRDQGPARHVRPEHRLGEAPEEPRRARALARDHRGAGPRHRDQHPRRGPGGARSRSTSRSSTSASPSRTALRHPRALPAGRRRVRQLPGGVRQRQDGRGAEDDRDPLLPGRTSCASSSASSRRPATSTSRSARARRSASTTRTPCSTRWPRSSTRARRTWRTAATSCSGRQEVRRGGRPLRDAVPGRSDASSA